MMDEMKVELEKLSPKDGDLILVRLPVYTASEVARCFRESMLSLLEDANIQAAVAVVIGGADFERIDGSTARRLLAELEAKADT